MNHESNTLRLHTEDIRIDIVDRFISAGTNYISGGNLADELSITRTAVWKHIRGLEDLGFEFDAVPRRGYRLIRSPNIILQSLLQPYLRDDAELGSHVVWYPSVASTNVIANQLARQPATEHGTVVAALRQEGGKGRHGRNWNSPEGGLWMSVVLKRSFPLLRAAEVTLMASVAVARAVETVTGVSLDIKWPNDLLYKNKKVCGILAELRAGGESVDHVVLGIGLNSNVADAQIPHELKRIATSLLIESGAEVNQSQLAGAILSEFETMYRSLVNGDAGFVGVADEWRKRCVTIGRSIRVQTPQGLVEGTAINVDNQGVLQLRLTDGSTAAIHSGDVLF
ncbi:biotin--[acetyl-CoA-carboxylase] ligase [Alicyclobacillus sp. SO9]|uniref:biotin--[acetyl-CoA-carboxylase] ligase n=1 Tax=Alicyclobacillus sp. SO9 TaxID=2665646 RepID=UPI0018E901A7|nr:biotin--[acetyl-CoA-carboxylase] ligase [Alicyclobacillus sp. SO9]QQE76781.1 biotin--[acetyl-CoA-carboxylase] ligase [Alicyclobacillus sp. SO9]